MRISLGSRDRHRPIRRVFAARAATDSGTDDRIGTKNFAEEYILGQLYKQALEAKGFTVSYKENIGSTELIQTALTSGKINFYPEYTGVIVQVVFHNKSSPKTGRRPRQLAKSSRRRRVSPRSNRRRSTTPTCSR